MRSGIHQAAGGVLFLRGALFRRQRLPLVARKADFVARRGQRDRPHSCIQAFRDIRRGIADLDAPPERKHSQQDGVAVTHERLGTPAAHLIGRHAGVRRIP